MEILELKNVQKEEWDKRALFVSEACVFQLSSFLTRPLFKLDDFKPIFIVAKDGDKILGQVVIAQGSDLTRTFADSPFFFVIKPILNHFFKVQRLLYGPLIFNKDRYYEILEEIVKYLDESIFSNCMSVKNITPPIHDFELDHDKVRAIYEKYGFISTKWGSFITDVSKEKEELWSMIGKESRSKIRKAEKQGVKIVEVKSEEQLQSYYRIAKELSKRNGLPIKSWEAFKSSLEDPTTTIFMSYLRDIPLSGQMALVKGRVVLLGAVTTSNYSIENKIFGNDLVQWHVIKWSKNKGCLFVDSVGVSPDKERHTKKESGIFNFKKRWGGKLVSYYHYEKIYQPVRFNFLSKCKILAKKNISYLNNIQVRAKDLRFPVKPVDRILSATSMDGLNFIRDDDIQVDSMGNINREMLYFPDVNEIGNNRQRMYFHSSRRVNGKWKGEIQSAITNEKGFWVREGKVQVGALSKDDDLFLQTPRLIKFGGISRLYYARKLDKTNFIIEMASTDDGINFKKVTSVSMNFTMDFPDLCLVVQDNCLQMFYLSKKCILSAISQDGIHWFKENGVRFERGKPGMMARVNNPFVVRLECGRYRMYFRGTDNNAYHSCIFSAISNNGKDFFLEDGQRIDYNGKYEKHGVGFPNVIKYGESWKMYYTGYWGRHLLEPYTIGKWK